MNAKISIALAVVLSSPALSQVPVQTTVWGAPIDKITEPYRLLRQSARNQELPQAPLEVENAILVPTVFRQILVYTLDRGQRQAQLLYGVSLPAEATAALQAHVEGLLLEATQSIELPSWMDPPAWMGNGVEAPLETGMRKLELFSLASTPTDAARTEPAILSCTRGVNGETAHYMTDRWRRLPSSAAGVACENLERAARGVPSEVLAEGDVEIGRWYFEVGLGMVNAGSTPPEGPVSNDASTIQIEATETGDGRLSEMIARPPQVPRPPLVGVANPPGEQGPTTCKTADYFSRDELHQGALVLLRFDLRADLYGGAAAARAQVDKPSQQLAVGYVSDGDGFDLERLVELLELEFRRLGVNGGRDLLPGVVASAEHRFTRQMWVEAPAGHVAFVRTTAGDALDAGNSYAVNGERRFRSCDSGVGAALEALARTYRLAEVRDTD